MVYNTITPFNIALFNENLRYDTPETIIKFVLKFASNPVVSTSFGGHSAAILYATTKLQKDIKVIWCDTGFNTEATKNHAKCLIESFQLNIEIFRPVDKISFLRTKTGLPDLSNPDYALFAETVKLEPFRRAMRQYNPDVWFTTVRKNQTAYRDSLDILSFTEDGVLKVSPFYHFNDEQIKAYLKKFNLPAEYDYFDPVKANDKRECGIQLLF